MNLTKSQKRFVLGIISLFSLIFTLNLFVIAQEDKYEQTDNWFQKYGYNDAYLSQRYDLYSRKDLDNFKEKLDLLYNAKPKNDWEGTYFPGGHMEVGFSQFRWTSEFGFADFYIYTCLPELRYINYGKAVDTPNFVQFIPEFTNESPKKRAPFKYVKVKWRETLYLVEESSLLAFSEKAVGIYVEPENTDDENYQKWVHFVVKGGSDSSSQELPEFPKTYSQFKRFPIESKIVGIGKREIEEDEILGNMIYKGDSVFYSITIGAGKNEGVKIGMKFYVPEINEEISITEVSQKSSTGSMQREIDDNKNDVCRDEEYNPISCPQIKKSLAVKTYIGRFWY